MRKILAIVSLAIALFALAFPRPAFAADAAHGAQIFNANCAACHAGGRNLVVSTKTLQKADLEKYGMASIEAISTQVQKGKNAMPAFESKFSAQDIEDVATYVLQKADQGW
jgi:cytochrome c6